MISAIIGGMTHAMPRPRSFQCRWFGHQWSQCLETGATGTRFGTKCLRCDTWLEQRPAVGPRLVNG